jgi:voltage-gated sodium channel
VAVVLVSLLSLFTANLPGAAALRTMRCLRVFRLFKRVPSLRQIVVSLVAAFPPMTNALLIVLLFVCVYSIMAAQFFSGVRPDLFGDFFGSLFTMFQIMTGDAWSDTARDLFQR